METWPLGSEERKIKRTYICLHYVSITFAILIKITIANIFIIINMRESKTYTIGFFILDLG